MKRLVVASIMVLVMALPAAAGEIYRATVDGVKFYSNKKIANYDKSWPEIKFNAEEHKARLARDQKMREYWQKQDQIELDKLKARVEARKARAMEQLAYMRAYTPPTYYSCNNYTTVDRPRYYTRRWYKRRPVYVYPNISTRQHHARVGHPLYWR